MTPSEMTIKKIIEDAGRTLSKNTIAAVVYATLQDESKRVWLDFTDDEYNAVAFLSVDRLVSAFSTTMPCFDGWVVPTEADFNRFEVA